MSPEERRKYLVSLGFVAIGVLVLGILLWATMDHDTCKEMEPHSAGPYDRPWYLNPANLGQLSNFGLGMYGLLIGDFAKMNLGGAGRGRGGRRRGHFGRFILARRLSCEMWIVAKPGKGKPGVQFWTYCIFSIQRGHRREAMPQGNNMYVRP